MTGPAQGTRRETKRMATGDGPLTDGAATLAESLFELLTEAILSGEIPLGSKISEPMLAQKYNVSRGPLREALHRLQGRQLITRSANQGARVVEATPETLGWLFELREVVEGMTARLAAANMTDAQRAALLAVMEQHETNVAGLRPGTVPALGASDRDFHFLIAEASGNPMLVHLLFTDLHPLMRLYRRRYENIESSRRAAKEHRRVVDAILDRDPEMAEMMMRRHISSAKARRLKAMEG